MLFTKERNLIHSDLIFRVRTLSDPNPGEPHPGHQERLTARQRRYTASSSQLANGHSIRLGISSKKFLGNEEDLKGTDLDEQPPEDEPNHFYNLMPLLL